MRMESCIVGALGAFYKSTVHQIYLQAALSQQSCTPLQA